VRLDQVSGFFSSLTLALRVSLTHLPICITSTSAVSTASRRSVTMARTLPAEPMTAKPASVLLTPPLREPANSSTE
jgi:hypothetical protein